MIENETMLERMINELIEQGHLYIISGRVRLNRSGILMENKGE